MRRADWNGWVIEVIFTRASAEINSHDKPPTDLAGMTHVASQLTAQSTTLVLKWLGSIGRGVHRKSTLAPRSRGDRESSGCAWWSTLGFLCIILHASTSLSLEYSARWDYVCTTLTLLLEATVRFTHSCEDSLGPSKSDASRNKKCTFLNKIWKPRLSNFALCSYF